MESEYVNIKEIADILGVEQQTVRKIMKDIPMYRISRKVALWKKADLFDLIVKSKIEKE